MEDYTTKQYLEAFARYSSSNYGYLKPVDGLKPSRLIRAFKFKLSEYIREPDYFTPSGLLTFHGSQGQGKTLTAAAVYCHNLMMAFPCCILCTNTKFKDRPFNAYIKYNGYTQKQLEQMYSKVKQKRILDFIKQVTDELTEDFLTIKYPEFTLDDYIKKNIPFHPFNEQSDFEEFCQTEQYQIRDIMTDEIITPEKIKDGTFKNVTIEYWGIDCLKYVNNGKLGVLFFIDEIHLEFNNLDKNIPLEVMVEISQQRKQRKHIVGTSQCFRRSAKFLREQTNNCVACKCFFGLIQYNKLIDGESIDSTSDGKLSYKVIKRNLFFHDIDLYRYYDTYAKMKRYNNEWTGKPSIIVNSSTT